MYHQMGAFTLSPLRAEQCNAAMSHSCVKYYTNLDWFPKKKRGLILYLCIVLKYYTNININ